LERLEKFVKLKVHQVESNSDSSEEVKVIINKLIDGVTTDLENLRYNTAIAKMMEALNKMSNVKCLISNEDVKTLIKLIAPMAPYMAEELFFYFGGTHYNAFVPNDYQSVHISQWPVADKKYLVENEVTIMIAINGKVRDQISVDRSQISDEKMIIEKVKVTEKMQKWIGGRKIVKEIYVAGKMINFVILD